MYEKYDIETNLVGKKGKKTNKPIAFGAIGLFVDIYLIVSGAFERAVTVDGYHNETYQRQNK